MASEKCRAFLKKGIIKNHPFDLYSPEACFHTLPRILHKGGCEVEFWPFCLAVIMGETGVGGQQRLSGTAQSLCNPLCCNEGLLVCSNKSLYTFFLSR